MKVSFIYFSREGSKSTNYGTLYGIRTRVTALRGHSRRERQSEGGCYENRAHDLNLQLNKSGGYPSISAINLDAFTPNVREISMN